MLTPSKLFFSKIKMPLQITQHVKEHRNKYMFVLQLKKDTTVNNLFPESFNRLERLGTNVYKV